MEQKHIALQADLVVIPPSSESRYQLPADELATFKRVAGALGVVVLTDSEKEFVLQACVTMQAAAQHLTSYFDLCTMIRARARGKGPQELKRVRKMLLALGYHKVTVSELTNVSLLPEKEWAMYHSKVIGFKTALQMTRTKKGDGLRDEERIKASAMSFVNRLFHIGKKASILEGALQVQKTISVGDYEITVVKKARKPNPINSGKKGKKK